MLAGPALDALTAQIAGPADALREAALPGIRHELISRYTSDIRRLLHQAGHVIQPAPRQLAILDDLYRHATAAGITIPAKIKPAC